MKWKLIIPLIVGAGLTLFLMIAGFIGVGFYVSRTNDTKNYLETQCFVDASYVDEKFCRRSSSSSSTTKSSSTTSFETCYTAIWEVSFVTISQKNNIFLVGIILSTEEYSNRNWCHQEHV